MLICRCGGQGIWDAPTDEVRCADCGAVLTRNRSTVADLQRVGSVVASGNMDVPALTAEVQRLEAENARLRKELEDWEAHGFR